jgi:hypothetical protein
MPELDKIFENWKSGIASFGETFAATMQLVSESGTASQQAFMAVGASMQQYAEQGGASLKELANTALGAAAKVIRAQIMQGVTAAAMKALTSVPFPFNIAAATAAGAIAGTLFNGLISKIGVPKLAKGGLAYAPTMAIVGDNPGASSNPEVIAPLDKLQRIMGGGSQPYIATIKADYDGLYLNLERTRQRRERSRGY